jgi:hypothetical protein
MRHSNESEVVKQQRITNKKLDKILLAFKSWQKQDDDYHLDHKKNLEEQTALMRKGK